MPVLRTFVLVSATLLCCQNALADSCMQAAKTQMELNTCADTTFKKADKELNELYKKILAEYADDPKFIEKFKASQRAWIKFRDAELDALFPHQDEDRYYGSIFPMCLASWRTTLTEERIAQLKKWSNKVPEGDACSGSIKVKE